MKLTTKIPLLILLLGFLSCTKGGGNIYVEGRVYNPVTGEGIPDIELRLYRPEMGGTIGNSSGNKTVETVYTDAEGHYEVSHLGGAYTYRLRISPDHEKFYALGTAPNNFDVPVGNGAFIVDKGTNMEVDFEIVGMGEYQFYVKNTNCQGSNDNIKIYYEGAQVDDEPNRVGDVIIDLDGCIDIPGGNVWVSHPMGNRYYRWEVTKNGVTQTYYDTIYIAPGEQRVYEVFY